MSSCVVLASEGYPQNYDKGFEIFGTNKFSKNRNIKIYHAGTKKSKTNKLLTAGGRVLNIVGKDKSIKKALDISYKACVQINWKGSFYRKDIGS